MTILPIAVAGIAALAIMLIALGVASSGGSGMSERLERYASAVDLIVHQTRFKDGSRRITSLTEVERMEGDIITLQDIYVYDHSSGFDEDGKAQGYLRSTGLRPKFLDKMEHSNVHVDPMLFAMEGLR